MLLYCLDCSRGTLSLAVSCVNGTVREDIVCKASRTGQLISLGNCSQSSIFMDIFRVQLPKIYKEKDISSHKQKKKVKIC